MNVIKVKNNKFEIYANGTNIVNCNMPKFIKANIYRINPSGNEPKLHADLVEGFNMMGDELDWDKLFSLVMHTPAEEEVVETAEPLPTPTIPFADIIKTVKHAYETEVYACILAQKKDVKNPAWLAVIAPPSTGKSNDLRICHNENYSILLDSVTDNALAAARPNNETELSDDVFTRAQDMTLIFNDMGSMFGDNQDRISKFVGYLTTAFGGNFNRAGPTEIRTYNTEMAVIMGMTPQVFYSNLKHFNRFGQRFLSLKYTCDDIEEVLDDDDFVDVDYSNIRNNIQSALNRDWDIPFEENVKEVMKTFVKKIVKLRSFFFARNKHELERPHRLFNQLKNLMRSRARLHEHETVTMEDFKFIKPLVWLSIPNIQFLFNLMHCGILSDIGLNRIHMDAIRNGKKLGLIIEKKSGTESRYWLTKVIDEWYDFLVKMGYEDVTIGLKRE